MVQRAAIVALADPWIRWDWVRNHTDLIQSRTVEHLKLTLIAVGLGLVIAIPTGIACQRWRRLYPPVLGVMGVVYSIPSLALLAMLVPFTGLTTTTSEIALVSYTLLILIRNVVSGLDGVAPEVKEAARGMGFSPVRQLVRIELPLALPAIVAGIRIATVTTVGLVTITALLGQGGLGQLVYDGLLRDFRTPLVIGTVLAVALATVADLTLSIAQRLLTPWARRRG